MNEELQSANEELETSKEELQSLNEELSTVNNQLHEKVEEVEAAKNDMANLLNSHRHRHRLPGRRPSDQVVHARRHAPVQPDRHGSSAGRIGDIVKKFTDDDLLREAQQLLRDLTPREKEVRTEDGRWYVRRIMPYRTLDNRIDGVVITFVDITERKQAADAVVRRLAAVVESSADAIFSKDLDGTIRTWNRGAERLYGYSRDEAVGRSVKMLVPEDRVDEWAKVMARLARGEHVEQLETERVRKDGQRVPVALTVSPIRDSDGKVVSASVTGRDISERKRAEQTLHSKLAGGEPSGRLDPGAGRGRKHRVHERRFDKLYGYSPGELLGRPVSVLNMGHGDQPRETAEEILRVLRKEGLWNGEVHNVKKDGTHFWTYASISAFEHPDYGEVWVSAISDVTDRIRAEEALRESEQRFRLMADAAPVLIWMTGADKLCSWFNKSWLDFVGRPMEKEIGNGWTENVHPEDLDGTLKTYATSFDARRPFSMEYRLKRYDGEPRWLLDNGTPLFAADGNFTGFIGSCIDITERKRAEQELRASEERLEAILNTAVDAIITIDHDGIIQSVNPATERMFGYTAAEMIGQNVKMLMPSPYREEHNDRYMARYLQTGEKHIIGISREVEARRKDGSIFPTTWRSARSSTWGSSPAFTAT